MLAFPAKYLYIGSSSSTTQLAKEFMIEPDILTLLRETKAKALAHYSNFHVASVLKTREGDLITGFNIENSSYGLTICAERVAIFKALSEGYSDFVEVYVMCDGDEPCSPCGACRQILFEYAPQARIIMVTEAGKSRKMHISELLPLGFNDKSLQT